MTVWGFASVGGVGVEIALHRGGCSAGFLCVKRGLRRCRDRKCDLLGGCGQLHVRAVTCEESVKVGGGIDTVMAAPGLGSCRINRNRCVGQSRNIPHSKELEEGYCLDVSSICKALSLNITVEGDASRQRVRCRLGASATTALLLVDSVRPNPPLFFWITAAAVEVSCRPTASR